MTMRLFQCLVGAVALGCLAGACGGNAGEAPEGPPDRANAGSGNAGSGNAGSVGDGNGGSSGRASVPEAVTPLVPRVPLKHRAAAEACDRERPPGSVSQFYDVAAPDDAEPCTTDADCTPPPTCTDCLAVCVSTSAGKVCINSSGSECIRDADCSTGENGRCEFRRGLACTYDECFADGDCNRGGPCGCEGGVWSDSNACLLGNCRTDAECGSGYCSPSFGDCGDYSGVIGYYCHTPEDTCVDDTDCSESGAGYCMYRPEVAHWACGYGVCVG
jgi:hypothetical protein